MTANAYSAHWFECFHSDISEERTSKEVEFIRGQAPLPEFKKVADVCCGMGRHARALAAFGYEVTGIERDPMVVEKANRLAGGPEYVLADVLEHSFAASSFDLVIVMSQSFGHFGSDANHQLLVRLASAVRQGGVVILDLWNPDFFIAHQGPREFNLPQGRVVETKWTAAERLFVHLDYPDGSADDFEWQLFTPVQLAKLAGTVGLRLHAACTGYDANLVPRSDSPRLHCVLRKVA